MISMRVYVKHIWVSLALALLPLSVAVAQEKPDGNIYKWNGQSWTQVAGEATRISVGPDGAAWVVNSRGETYRWTNGSFQRLPGKAKDIGVGADGSVWIIGWDNGIYKWNRPAPGNSIGTNMGLAMGSGWTQVPGAAVTISVQINGSPWVVNADGEIYRWIVDRFVLQVGRAREIGVERGGWMIDPDGLLFKYAIGEWRPVEYSGVATRISIGPDSSPWIVNSQREIYHLVNGEFQKLPGRANDIGVGADGSVWIVGDRSMTSQTGGQISTFPQKADAGRLLGSSKNTAAQDFKYPPNVIVAPNSAEFEFVTTQPTIPTVEVSTRPPEPGPRFNQAAVVSTASPVEVGKQLRHKLHLENLKPGTRYYYIITVSDEDGKMVSLTGEFITSVRIDD